MSCDVIITGSHEYGMFVLASDRTSSRTFDYELRNGWADRMDVLADGRASATGPAGAFRSRAAGQRLMHAVVPVPGGVRDSGPEFTARAIEVTIGTYAKAAQWSRGGTVAVLVEHGAPGLLPLAPGHQLTVDGAELQDIARRSASGTTRLTAKQQAVTDLGRALHHGGRAQVREVMLLSCSIGVGPAGQVAVAALARVWGVPVLALVGDFWIARDIAGTYESWVAAGGGNTNAPMLGLRYRNGLPRDPRLFRRSRAHP
jgi:hypothetical protein